MDKPPVLSLAEVREIAADAERFGRPLGSLWVLRLCAAVEHYAAAATPSSGSVVLNPKTFDELVALAEEADDLRQDALAWRTLMSEAAEHLKEPEHLARVARVEAAIAHEAEELRLLRDHERATLAVMEGPLEDRLRALGGQSGTWQALRSFRERGQ